MSLLLWFRAHSNSALQLFGRSIGFTSYAGVTAFTTYAGARQFTTTATD